MPTDRQTTLCRMAQILELLKRERVMRLRERSRDGTICGSRCTRPVPVLARDHCRLENNHLVRELPLHEKWVALRALLSHPHILDDGVKRGWNRSLHSDG